MFVYIKSYHLKIKWYHHEPWIDITLIWNYWYRFETLSGITKWYPSRPIQVETTKPHEPRKKDTHSLKQHRTSMLERHNWILLKRINIEIWRCFNVEVWPCFNVEVWRCFTVEIWSRFNIEILPCFNVEIWRCFNGMFKASCNPCDLFHVPSLIRGLLCFLLFPITSRAVSLYTSTFHLVLCIEEYSKHKKMTVIQLY